MDRRSFFGSLLAAVFVPPSRSIDPRDYGAVGDGVTNDTVAVQKALIAAGKQGIPMRLVPGKTFLVGSLQLPTGAY